MPKKPVPPEVAAYFQKIGKRYGALGGKTAAENMTPEERSARAKKASAAAAVARTKKARAKKK